MLAALLQPAAEAVDTAAPVVPAAPGGYGLFLLETLFILVVVCALAWAFIRFGVKRLYAAPGAGGAGPLRVLARLSLEPRRTLYIVEAAGKTVLVGSGDGGTMTLIAELDEEAVRRAIAAQPQEKSFLEILAAKRKAASAAPPPPPSSSTTPPTPGEPR